MMPKLLFFAALVAAAAARNSPNADFVKMQYASHRDFRYSDDILEDANLDVPGLIKKYGYPVEVHSVVTEDGYILEMHRIPHGGNSDPAVKRIPILVMHGLLSSSADFLTTGPGNALGYHLADIGYDVWLGNARGNFYSRQHIRLNPDSIFSRDFWRFSWDEIGNFDLPAFIDFILSATGQPKLHYIGHSQGGTSFLVLSSLRPEYNDKFYSFQGLAPASFFTYNNNSLYNGLAPYEDLIENAAFALGFAEVFGNRNFTEWFRDNFCSRETILESFCDSVLTGIQETAYLNSTLIPVILGHTPAGASVRQIAHYGQVIRFNSFRRYNFNRLTNLAVYGSSNPPIYDLSGISVPSFIYYGLSDEQVHYRDILKLVDTLPNVIEAHKMERDTFNHFDFIWGIDAKEQYYDALDAWLKFSEEL